MQVRLIAVVFMFSSCCHLGQQKLTEILREKGLDDMKERLVPQIIQSQGGICAVMGIGMPNKFILVNGRGEFCLASLDSAYGLDVEPVVENFPPVACSDYRTDGKAPIVWARRGRAFYGLDIANNIARHVVVSHDGDEEIIDSYLADPASGMFMIRVVHHGWTSDDTRFFFVLFDLHSGSILGRTDSGGSVYPLGNGLLLHDDHEWDDSGKRTVRKWLICGPNLDDSSGNSLTEILNKFQLKMARGKRCYSPEYRMLIGTKRTGDRYLPFVVRWQEDFMDADADSLTAQVPQAFRLSNFVWFCPHDPWVKACLYQPLGKNTDLVFYRIDDAYPQHLSPPILGGYSSTDGYGAFVNHTELGPLYVDMDDQHPGILLVYKLNDALELLKKAVK